ncbi:MAG: hypothetical protein LBB56_00795 [Chitinispirillales bacterium]|jgi:hypothetical protein|nr:hypothetical protein [Chitinispirillales bacterium]
MERMWSGDAEMKYQKQWIVMVNLANKRENDGAYKTIGDVYLVTPNEKEAYAKAKSLGNSLGENMVFEGFDDTLQLGGGLEPWNL